MSTAPVSTDTTGNQVAGTTGTQISNGSTTNLNSSEFLNLMLDELEHQDPMSPSSSDPTQYLSELAQMTSVEQETNTAQNTAASATSAAVSSAISLIGDTISYVDKTSGATVSGKVQSVQITSSGATLTVDGVPNVALGSITNVSPSAS